MNDEEVKSILRLGAELVILGALLTTVIYLVHIGLGVADGAVSKSASYETSVTEGQLASISDDRFRLMPKAALYCILFKNYRSATRINSAIAAQAIIITYRA